MPARPRLRPVPDTPLRALGLVRVSKEREEMVSPEIQRTAIDDQCARRGYRIVGWIEGIDESGSRRKSKWWAKLDQAVEQVEAGTADVIVVWRFDRTARNRLRWAVALDRVETAGGLLESATEPLDTSTASGRFARGMLGEMAAYRAEEIGATWREVHARRTSKGLPTDGRARFGYRIVDGVNVPDSVTGPVLAELYGRYLAGQSFYSLTDWLTATGVPTGSDKAWSSVRLRRILDSGFAAGYIMVRGERVAGVHEPVIDAETWQAYLASRVVRRPLKRVERSPYLLSGLVRCGHVLDDGSVCGSSMTGGKFNKGTLPMFRCGAMVRTHRHRRGYVPMATVEKAVLDWLQDVASKVNEAKAVDRADRRPVRRRQLDADALARELVALERQLVELTRQLAREVIPESAYIAARDDIEASRTALRERHARAVLDGKEPVNSAPLAAALLQDWDVLLVEERRAILRRLVDHVVVTRVGGRPKASVVPVGAASPR